MRKENSLKGYGCIVWLKAKDLSGNGKKYAVETNITIPSTCTLLDSKHEAARERFEQCVKNGIEESIKEEFTIMTLYVSLLFSG